MTAACGGAEAPAPPPKPKLPSAVARELAASSDRVGQLAATDSCAAAEQASKLREATIAAINGGRIAAALQEELLAAVNALAASIACNSQVPVAAAQAKARALSSWLRRNADG